MPNATDPHSNRRERLERFWSRVRLIAAFTSPIWIVALLGEGSLGNRLLGAVVLPLIGVLILYSMRWLVYGIAFLAVVRERWVEKKKGELKDAEKY